jgi:hypothetical protein
VPLWRGPVSRRSQADIAHDLFRQYFCRRAACCSLCLGQFPGCK